MVELIPGLPEELGLECLTRLSYTTHQGSSRVCRRWRQLLRSREFFSHRKRCGYTRHVACLVQSLPVTDTEKHKASPSYQITMFDPESQTWDRLDAVQAYPDGLPLFCQVASSEGKLVVMGGWNPRNYGPVVDVFVYDFITSQWKRGTDMPCKRSFFAIGTIGCHVYVAGGHDENKNALKSAWTYDIGKDEWTELPQMNQERDECEGVVIENEFHVVSGYSTENQGEFNSSLEVYNVETGHWNQVEAEWKVNQCPRSRVGVAKDGKLMCWAESDTAVRVGVSAVKLGAGTLLTGSAYESAPQKCFLMGMNGEQNSYKVEIAVPHEFNGLVQSGCSVEI